MFYIDFKLNIQPYFLNTKDNKKKLFKVHLLHSILYTL